MRTRVPSRSKREKCNLLASLDFVTFVTFPGKSGVAVLIWPSRVVMAVQATLRTDADFQIVKELVGRFRLVALLAYPLLAVPGSGRSGFPVHPFASRTDNIFLRPTGQEANSRLQFCSRNVRIRWNS